MASSQEPTGRTGQSGRGPRRPSSRPSRSGGSGFGERSGGASGRQSDQRSRVQVTPARRLAYNVLHEVATTDSYANLALRQALAGAELDSRDAAFATELVYGALRNRMALDQVLAQCVDRPLIKVDPRLLDILRLGAYQWVFLRSAAHACVATTVDLAADVAGMDAKRFVNAVLRRVVNDPPEQWLAQLSDPSVRFSHPDWIVTALTDALGPSGRGEIAALLAADNDPAPVTLAARPGLCDGAELLAAGAQPARWGNYAFTAPAGNVKGIAAVRERRAGVQDEGSQLVVEAFANAQLAGSDARWLDLCAGPGGKATLLAAIGAPRGARLLAVDINPVRAGLVRDALEPLAKTALTVVADGRALPGAGFDRVLLDAPCSGLGVIRRRPDIRWRRRPADVSVLARLQIQLLTAAIAAVRPGGIVGYSTCSPHIAETVLVVSQAVKAGKVELIDARQILPNIDGLGPGPEIRLWPHRHGTDGMYLALLRRIG